MTLAAFFATIAAYIVQFGFYFGGGFGGGYGSSDDDDNLGFIAVFLVSIAVYAISFLLMRMLSRYREFAADRGAAIITGRPSVLALSADAAPGPLTSSPICRWETSTTQPGSPASALSSALMKISSGMHNIPQKDLRATEQLAAFYIFPPGLGKGLGQLFATHPSMEKRIEALSRLEGQLQSGR